MSTKELFPFNQVYCISLPTSVDRRNHLTLELKKNNIESFEFVDAINKDDNVVEKAYNDGTVLTFPPCFRCGEVECDCQNNVLIPTQVATFFSHMKVWKKIAQQKVGFFLIIEDDIVFNEQYTLTKEKIHNKINDLYAMNSNHPLLLRLGWGYDDEHKYKKVELKDGLIRMSNPMYAINPHMADVLLNSFDGINHTVDVYTHLFIGPKYANFTLFPPLAHELSWSHGAIESLIRPRRNRLQYLREHNDDMSKSEIDICASHIDKAIKKKVLVVGHPQTGADYINTLFISCGINAGYEKMGKDGIISCMFSVFDLKNPFGINKYAQSRFFVDFDHIIMFIRDPFTAIPCIMCEDSSLTESYQFRKKHILCKAGIDLDQISDPVERALESYYQWVAITLEINNPNLIMRVEFDQKKIFKFLGKNGFYLEYDKNELPTWGLNREKEYNVLGGQNQDLMSEIWLDLALCYKQKINTLCSMLKYNPIYDNEFKRVIR